MEGAGWERGGAGVEGGAGEGVGRVRGGAGACGVGVEGGAGESGAGVEGRAGEGIGRVRGRGGAGEGVGPEQVHSGTRWATRQSLGLTCLLSHSKALHKAPVGPHAVVRGAGSLEAAPTWWTQWEVTEPPGCSGP